MRDSDISSQILDVPKICSAEKTFENILSGMLSLQVFVTLNVSRLANDRLTIKHKRQDPKTCDIEAAYDFILAVVYLLIKQRNYFCFFPFSIKFYTGKYVVIF